MTLPEQLYKTLNERRRPEDVAQMIIELAGDSLNFFERLVLERAARGSLLRNVFGYTSMLQTFAEAKGAGPQVRKAIEIFKLDVSNRPDYTSAEEIEAFINEVSLLIYKPVGHNNFKTDRLNKTGREEKGLDISKRNYNKKWRLLKRIEKKLRKFIRESKKIELQKIAKHGLAHTIRFEDFVKDLDTACFIAYYTARRNRRSVFTNESQDRPFDEICEMLLNRCRKQPDEKKGNEGETNWWAIAHVYTTNEVLSHLTDVQKGELLGRWTNLLQEIAMLLDEIWKENKINRESMIVQRGNDSTTWNNTAGAWNEARDNWMNLIYSLGMEYVLDDLCFGKALRLMAADVAAWHRLSGGGLDPNTRVWNALPLPWEVFQGKAECNRGLVVAWCRQAGIDPEKSGWIAPKLHSVTQFRPTPELVHGVEEYNPFLAAILKKNKYFSGKGARPLYPEQN